MTIEDSSYDLFPSSGVTAPLVDGANDMHASYAEDAAEEDGITDFFTQGGAVSAITSGAVSMWNTGADLATYLGAEDYSVKTEDVISNFMSSASVDYYKRHQEGLDTLGFVATSLIPGMQGIKGLRALQSGIKSGAVLSSRTKLATGIRSALVPTERAANMRAAIETAEGGMNNINKVGLFKEAFHQQALEAAAFEGAVLLTMNQNPTSNKDDLDYFDSIAKNATDPLALTLLGAGALGGGAIDGIIKYSGLKKLVSLKELVNNHLFKVTDIGEGAALAGDKVSFEFKRYKELSDLYKSDPANKKAAEAMNKQRDVALDTIIKGFPSSMDKNQATALAGKMFNLFTQDEKTLTDLFKLSGTQRYNTIGSLETLGNVQSKSHVLYMDSKEFLNANSKFEFGLRNILKGQEPTYDPDNFLQTMASEKAMYTANGFALPQEREVFKNEIRKIHAGSPRLDEYLKYADDLVDRSFSSIGQMLKVVDRAGLKKLDADSVAFTVMHEIGHLSTNMPTQGVLDLLYESGNIHAKRLLTQLEGISRKTPNRTRSWDRLDELAAKLKLNPTDVQTAEDFANINGYLRSPHEMLADTWEEITRAIVDNDTGMLNRFKSEAPDVYKLFRIGANKRGIQALTDKLLPARRRLLNIETGELVDHGIAPTIADVGNIKTNFHGKIKTVSWGKQGNTTYGQVTNTTEFKPYDMNPQEANALYYLRMTDPTPVRYEVPISVDDLPRLTRALSDMTKGVTSEVKLVDGTINKTYTDVMTLKKDIGSIKDKLLNELRGKPVDSKLGGAYTYREIARILDINDEVAYKGYASYFEDNLSKFNFFHSLDRDLDVPTHISLQFGKNAIAKDDNGFSYVVQGMAATQRRIAITKNLARQRLGTYAGEELIGQLPTTVEGAGKANFADNITTADTTSGMFKSANEEYFNSNISYIGRWVNNLKSVKQKEVKDTIAPHVQAIIKSPEAKAHMAALDSLLRQRWYHYLATDSANLGKDVNAFKQEFAADLQNTILAKLGGGVGATDNLQKAFQNSKFTTFLEKMDDHTSVIYAPEEYGNTVGKVIDALSAGDVEQATKHIDSIIDNKYMATINDKAVNNFWRTYVGLNDDLVRNRRNLNQLVGRGIGGLQEGRLYPGHINTHDLPFFKFVISKNQEGISNDRSIGILTGRTAEELQSREKELLATYGDDVQVITKSKEDIERWKQLQAEYDANLAIDENSMNAEMRNKHKAWDVAPTPTERVVENYVNNLLNGHATLSREFVAAHFGEEVATLNNAAKDFEKVNRATWGAKTSLLGDKTNLWKKLGVGNPYSDKIRQMLDINNLPEYKTWYNLQQTVADKFNNMVQAIKQSTRLLAEDLIPPAEMNRVMEQYGLKPAFDENVTDYLYANTKIPRNTLQAGVAKINGFIGTLMLRMDGAQAMTDVLSTAITTAPEIKMLTKAIKDGELHKLLNVKIPNTDGYLPSASKVMFNSVKDLFSDRGRLYLKEYENLNLLSTTTREMLESVDDMAKVFDVDAAKANPSAYEGMVKGIGKKGMKALTYFNDKGVEFSKFISLRSADQIIEAAGITDQAMRRTILNTFVNRTHGNYLASQRPALFQGWGGQLIGLFQTYQFNLIQQFARHLGEDKAAALAMVGIQSGVFGAQSLPGFQALNGLILERNKGSGDLYTGTNNLIGNEMGEWLMYGLGSQVTTPITGNGISLYSRGNLTPRTPILIPTRIEDIPAVRFTVQSTSNAFNTIGRLLDAETSGQAKQAFLEGLAHNGLNRPLQGLGQLLSGGRTTSKGSVIVGYNELNSGLLLAKALGVSDLDEAIATDAFYRYENYTAAKNSKLNTLGEELKTTIRGGGVDSLPEITDKFLQRYTESGGKVQDFGRWMKGQFLGATQSQLLKVRNRLDSPEGIYMQGIMGADVPEDFALPKASDSLSGLGMDDDPNMIP